MYTKNPVSLNSMIRDFFQNILVPPKSIFILFSLYIVIIFIFLFRWQVLGYKYYNNILESRVKQEVEKGLRGTIFSNDGTTLAYSEIAYEVHIYKPTLEKIEQILSNGVPIQTRKELISKTAAILNILPEELESIINNPEVNDVIIAARISKNIADKLTTIPSDNDPNIFLRGFDLVATQKRIYPDNSLAASILGFIGKNEQGLDRATNGIEETWDGDLKPQLGYKKLERDGQGREVLRGERDILDFKDGNNIKITINKSIQKILEDKLKLGFEKYQAQYATGIIMNPKTGEIIAMGNYPSYNPNEYEKTPKDSLKFLNNLSITEPYEPGSVGKVLTLAAALNEDLVTADTMLVKSHSGCIVLSDHYQSYNVCDFGKVPNSSVTVRKMIEYSDNIGAYTLAKIVGETKMKDYLTQFGIGEILNFGLKEESNGFFNKTNEWTDIDFWSNSFGQSYGATAIQMTSAFSVFANNGVRMKPKIVESVIDEYSNSTIDLPNKIINTVMKPESTLKLNEIMTKNFQTYIKNNSRVSKYKEEILKYNLAGKTGTAQIAKSTGGYEDKKINTTFIGYDVGGSSFVFLLKLTEPKIPEVQNDASSNVFPLWVETFMEFKDILGVVKSEDLR